VPDLLRDFRRHCADATVQLVEDKTVRLLPRLLSGRLDLVLIRPPENPDKRIELLMLFHETPVVAVPSRHRLARRRRLSIPRWLRYRCGSRRAPHGREIEGRADGEGAVYH